MTTLKQGTTLILPTYLDAVAAEAQGFVVETFCEEHKQPSWDVAAYELIAHEGWYATVTPIGYLGCTKNDREVGRSMGKYRIVLTDEGANDWRKFEPQENDCIEARNPATGYFSFMRFTGEDSEFYKAILGKGGVMRIVERDGIPFPRYTVQVY